jgi:hypothetical protein
MADPASLQLGPQPGIGAVDLVAGHPGGRDAGVQGAGQHLGGQRRLGGKPYLVRDARSRQPFRILDPASGRIQLPVNHGVPGIGGVHQVDSDLGILHAARSASVLALHPHRLAALPEIPGLVEDQHRLRVAERLDQVGAEVIADPVVVPHRTAQQVLHPIRGGVAGVLGDRPAVLARQVGQQPVHERPGPPAWLHPREPARDPAQQLLQPPPAIGQGLRCGLRPPSDLWLSSQHQIINGGRPRLLADPACSLTSQVTIYGWSTSLGFS